MTKSSDFILWGVDDVLFYDEVDVSEAVRVLDSNRDVISASIRLAPQVTFCHPASASSIVPKCTHSQFHVDIQASHIVVIVEPLGEARGSSPLWLKFNRFEGTQDWNYPFELCATIFRKVLFYHVFAVEYFLLPSNVLFQDDVIALLEDIERTMGVEGISHPNKLEVCGSRLFARQQFPRWNSAKYCLCLSKLVSLISRFLPCQFVITLVSQTMSVVTINRVQDVCENPIYQEVDLATLDGYFWDGNEFDLSRYRQRSSTYYAVHVGDVFLTK